MNTPQYQSPSDEEAQEIASRYLMQIKSIQGDRLQPNQSPVIVLVGGQTGAGKSTLANEVINEIEKVGGAIPIDADELRELLPLNGSKPTGTETQKDALRLTDLVRERAIQEKYNIVEQGTFSNAETMQSWVDELRTDGYSVEMHVMATPREVSKVGLFVRHENEHKRGEANPRMVPLEVHDKSYTGILKTVRDVDFDRLKISSRDLGTLYDSRNPENSKVQEKNGAMSIGQMLVTSQKAWSIEGIQGAIEDAQSRGEEPNSFYIKSAYDVQNQVINARAYTEQERNTKIANSFEVEQNRSTSTGTKSIEEVGGMDRQGQRSEKLRRDVAQIQYGADNIESNVRELMKDRAYHSHSTEELTKAAFYRGVVSKDFADAGDEKGLTDRLQKFDAAMKDKEVLGKLALPELQRSTLEAAERVISEQHKNRDDGLTL